MPGTLGTNFQSAVPTIKATQTSHGRTMLLTSGFLADLLFIHPYRSVPVDKTELSNTPNAAIQPESTHQELLPKQQINSVTKHIFFLVYRKCKERNMTQKPGKSVIPASVTDLNKHGL